MAYRVNNLNNYDLVIFKDGTEFKMPVGAWHRGTATEIYLYLFPENKTLDYFDTFFQKSNNLTEFRITDASKESVYDTLRGYSYLESIGKERQGAYHDGYDNQGQYYKITSDLIQVILRRETAEDSLSKMQATMEYIAIMSDIDIDEEE